MIIHPAARQILQEKALRYECQQKGLGTAWLDAVEAGFALVRRNPQAWRQIRGDVRRLLVKGFPYGIIYAAPDDGEISVLAIQRLQGEPDYWLSRLRPLPLSPA